MYLLHSAYKFINVQLFTSCICPVCICNVHVIVHMKMQVCPWEISKRMNVTLLIHYITSFKKSRRIGSADEEVILDKTITYFSVVVHLQGSNYRATFFHEV
uniref:Uncharacterized protein n=1 Tax=Rhizophagus irregularis (strain DAOM 181602 / DAOM 197198 / MUCL 43194) TaxID=747089 RepID=U9TIL5_RHIID